MCACCCFPPPHGCPCAHPCLPQVRGLLEEAQGQPTAATTADPSQQRIDPSSNVALSRALATACGRLGRQDAAAAQLLKSLTTRAMSEAKYFSTGGPYGFDGAEVCSGFKLEGGLCMSEAKYFSTGGSMNDAWLG